MFLVSKCRTVGFDRIVQDVPFRDIVAMVLHEETHHGDLMQSPPPRVGAIRMAGSQKSDHLRGNLTSSRMETGEHLEDKVLGRRCLGAELSIEIITSFDCYLADHFEEVQRATPLSRESRLESGSSPGFPQFHINYCLEFVVHIQALDNLPKILQHYGAMGSSQRGSRGTRGPKGKTGSRGQRGLQGIPGPAGPAGRTGPMGPAGPFGRTGPTPPTLPLQVLARVAQQIEAIERDLQVQFQRIAELQADLDTLRVHLAKEAQPR
jgi:ribosomal protein L15